MTVIASGSSAQLVIAMLIVMANMLLVLKLGPFIDAADDVLAFTTSLQLMLTLLGGLLIATDDSSNKTYDPQFMDTAMILVQIPGFVGFLLSLLLLNPKIREKFNRCVEPTLPRDENLTKVIPINKKMEDEMEDEDDSNAITKGLSTKEAEKDGSNNSVTEKGNKMEEKQEMMEEKQEKIKVEEEKVEKKKISTTDPQRISMRHRDVQQLRNAFRQKSFKRCQHMVDKLKNNGLTHLNDEIVQGIAHSLIGKVLDSFSLREFAMQVSGKYAQAARLDGFMRWVKNEDETDAEVTRHDDEESFSVDVEEMK